MTEYNPYNCGGKDCDDIRCDDCDTFLQYAKHCKDNNLEMQFNIKLKDGRSITLRPGEEISLSGGGGGGGGCGT